MSFDRQHTKMFTNLLMSCWMCSAVMLKLKLKKNNDGVNMKHQNFKHQIPLNKSFISLWDYKIKKTAWGCDVDEMICFI